MSMRVTVCATLRHASTAVKERAITGGMGTTQSRQARPDLRIVLYTCFAAAMLVACSADPSVSPSSGPAITSLQPLTGQVGASVTITGTGFDARANTINFGASAYPKIA